MTLILQLIKLISRLFRRARPEQPKEMTPAEMEQWFIKASPFFGPMKPALPPGPIYVKTMPVEETVEDPEQVEVEVVEGETPKAPAIIKGLLVGVPYRPTSNKGGWITPRYLVNHYTASDSLEGTMSYFRSKESKVSAHLLIGRDGRMIQMVPFNRRAWHAGSSQWNGLIGMNDFSIGIEYINWGPLRYEDGRLYSRTGKQVPREDAVYLVGPDNEGRWWQRFTEEQLEVGFNVSRELFLHYGLEDALDHSQISPRRKIDPGPAFPSEELRSFCRDNNNSMI